MSYTYIKNDPEAANFMIKHGLHFPELKPHQFIEKIKNIVETNQQNGDRAVFGKGPYHLMGNLHIWVWMTRIEAALRMNKLKENWHPIMM